MDWNMVWQIALLIIGFVMLIKGADWFVDGAAGIADKLHIPQLIIGLTIVAMGTSAPEAAISISASVQGSADIAVGNILGSNILNILIILGITSVITPLAVQKSTVKYEIPFVIIISVIFGLIGLFDNSIGFIDGILLWVLFIAYIAYLFIMTKKGKIQADESDDEDNDKKPKKVWQLILFGIIGIALVVFGSNITVNAATEIATMFGMSERFIGLTIVALGTSLPELVTSITAALKKNADIAIGNIVGSNIFNILFYYHYPYFLVYVLLSLLSSLPAYCPVTIFCSIFIYIQLFTLALWLLCAYNYINLLIIPKKRGFIYGHSWIIY